MSPSLLGPLLQYIDFYNLAYHRCTEDESKKHTSKVKYFDWCMEVQLLSLLGYHGRPTNRTTEQQTDRPTDRRAHREVAILCY